MNKVQAFFNEPLEQEEIEISPFHKLGRKRKASMMREVFHKEDVQTPIVRYAFDILKLRPFDFAIIRYPSGKSGYNVKIRQLLEYCGIDRKVKSFDAEKKDNVLALRSTKR